MKKILILSVMVLAPLFANSVWAMNKAEASQILLSVVTEGNTVGVHQMLSLGANINIQDKLGKTPLLKAIDAGQIEIVSILLAHGANVNYEDPAGSTALILACENNYPMITEMITKRKVDLHHKNKKGYSALMISSMHGREDIVTQLVSVGAADGAELKDSDGNMLQIVRGKDKVKPVKPESQFYAGL